MITQQQADTAKAAHVEFMQQCTDYRALLTSMDLPFSVNREQLTQILRQRVADELLTADPSLKLRWEMLRTDAGREKLRAEVTATVDLAGYNDVEQIDKSLKQVEQYYALNIDRLPDQYRADFRIFAGSFQLDYGKLVDSRTMVWEGGKEQVLAYFTNLAEQLTQARLLMHALGHYSGRLEDVAKSLTRYYKPNYNARHDAQDWLLPDQEEVYKVAASLASEGKAENFPQSLLKPTKAGQEV